MIDLTPLDVRKKKGDFGRGLRGYDPAEVDEFLEMVSERLDELVKENLRLGARVERLEGDVEALGGREQAVQAALVTAQELSEDIRGQARREAETILREAEAEARSIHEEARKAARRTREAAEAALEDRRRELHELSRARTRFLKGLRRLVESELDAIEVAEAEAPERELPIAPDAGPPDPEPTPRAEPRQDSLGWPSFPEPDAAEEPADGGDEAPEVEPSWGDRENR